MAAFSDLPTRHFGAILADPPWRFETWSAKGQGRSPKYKTMTLVQIANMPVASKAADDCVLFMWVTWPMLTQGLWVIEHWGFRYKTCAFAWMKRRGNGLAVGTGYWTRANTEACLLATRGKPKRINANVAQAILEERREHSRKPDCVHGRIEQLVPGPYLELFARKQRPGWTAWGNETAGFNTAPGPVRRSWRRK